MAGVAVATEAAIELRDVTKTYELESGERVTALDGVSLTVEPGDFVCVLGPSGHGKSTMLNTIAGFISPTTGVVAAGGSPVTGPGADRGVVFQRDTLFAWKRVADNLGFGLKARGVPREERDEIVRRYLSIIGMDGYASAWPKQLSGGMRRRVAIAAVFANEPDVLLMDEPFVGLDYARRATLHEVLLELWSRTRKTVFFITHDIDEAVALADRIIVLVHGRIVHEARVELPRPRGVEDIAGAEAGQLRADVLRHLDLGARTA
jgi:NitT/TauT family transport system ATP-binding protein